MKKKIQAYAAFSMYQSLTTVCFKYLNTIIK